MIEPRLSEFVADILPAARIEKTFLPNQTGLALYLLNADYPQQGLTQSQMLRLMDEPFYWGFCWASGLVLSQYLLDNPEWVRGKRVVDFGCGSGVAALAALKAGAREVVACDIDPMAKYATLKNAELNSLTLSFSDDFQVIEGHVDIILVADVLYDKANLPWLASFVARADQVIVADSRVKNFDFPPYQQIARYEGCTIPDLDESQEFRDVRLYLASSI